MFSHSKVFFISSFVGVIVLSGLICGTFAEDSRAQTLPNLSNSLILTPSTNSPIPGQKMTIKAQSFIVDLNSSTIVWTVAGKEFARGVGKTEISVDAATAGKTLSVGIVAVTADGQRYSSSLTLGSGDVDLMIETDGYVPPFFKGKVPGVYQNTIKIIAVPHLTDTQGKEYDPSTLVYQWKKDWKALPSDSGYGKRSISMKGDLVPRPYIMTLTVSSRDGRAQAEKFITIEPGEPSILFYQDDPLYGTLYNRARASGFNVGSAKETSVLAVPYGFSKEQSGDLSYAWSINGTDHPELSTKPSITLRAPADSNAVAEVILQINNIQEILQGSTNAFTAVFSTPQKQTAGASF